MPESTDDARQQGRPPRPPVKALPDTNQKTQTKALKVTGRSPWSR